MSAVASLKALALAGRSVVEGKGCLAGIACTLILNHCEDQGSWGSLVSIERPDHQFINAAEEFNLKFIDSAPIVASQG